ncbi:tyrosine-type recombinase/integrase [Couchioplanes azureus]|uniref:tyrosine-type recombinase/integrase n=1 Tax=Couchioplanes caeruleus TaxID=56438 RepID=UPI0016708BF1|nr:site-specific integrase [Couchioplanes caeruleus]GGQ77720.1 site-specific integrase [Couchioplanes caeruleus subsp. azureus]
MTSKRRRAHGEGSVYEQRPGLWAASIDVGWVDGKRKRKTVYAASEKEAVRKRGELLSRQQRGENLAAPPRTLSQWLDEWMAMKQHESTRQSTLRGYRWLVESHVRPTLGRVPLDKLTPTMIRRVLTAKTGEGLSATTVRHIHGLVRNVLSDAQREELLHRNPALAVRAPSARTVERRALTVDEARRLLDSIAGERLEALWVCALTVGLRRGELLGLRWSDLDFAGGALTVRQTVLRVDGRLVFTPPKTDRSRRTVPVPAQTLALLRRHRRQQDEERAKADERWREHGLVFASRLGTPMEPRNLDREWHATRERAGLPWLRLHDLRHACATFLLASGASPRTVMQTLGHSQISLTMNTYAHVLMEVERAAMDAAADRLFGSAGAG